jgi:mannose-6-phosphate isomerase
MSVSALQTAAVTLRDWATKHALPLWASAGYDARTGRFYEELTLDGDPIPDTPVRLIVQARQVVSYALAARHKWHDGAHALVKSGYRSMIEDFYKADGKPGWTYARLSDGRIVDAKRDLYSHAFAMLAMNAYFSVTGDRGALALADETLSFLDTAMRAPKAGGYVEALPETTDIRRQNPHMHLFEAMLSLWSSSGEGRYLARAGEMYSLFASRFFRPDPGILGEYFTGALEPAAGEKGDIVEPGHHCEWVWLLRWFERESGRHVQLHVDALYDHAVRHGYDSAGLLVDEVTIDGRHRLPSHRTWPMTEAIKAHVVEAAAGREGAAGRAIDLMQRMTERFFAPVRAGGWMDRLDADGHPAARTMPASTLYHVMGAIYVAMSVDGASAPKSGAMAKR